MSRAELVLEYLTVLLSGPPVVAVTVFVLVCVFREDIKDLLGRVARIKFPGGELSTQAAREEQSGEEKAPPSVKASAADLPKGVTLTHEDQGRIVQLVQAQRAQATLWEYRYLGYYLVPGTQRVLDWLAGLPQATSIGAFDAFWSTIIPTGRERVAIMGALEQHHLVQRTGELVEVTPRGHEYIQWRGPLELPSADE